jgi:hypothetical protein
MAVCRTCGTPVEGRRQKCDDCKAGVVKSLAQTIAGGDFTASTKALAGVLAQKLEDAPAGKSAPVAKQLREVLDELARLKVLRVPAAPPTPPVEEPKKPEGVTDELKGRRARRRAGTKTSAATGSGQ